MKTFNEYLNEAKKTFSASQITKLKSEYGKIDKINPTSPTYKKLHKKLEGMSPEMLKQIVDAKIKFLRWMAAGILRNKK